jgi:predicted dehydrogenase
MQAVLKAGVAGAGVFGGYHAKKLHGLEGVELTRIFDHNREHGAALAEPLAASLTDDYDAFLDGLDLVVVALPAESHALYGLKAIRAGAHVYVEKPLAVTLADADALTDAARKAGVVGACGHQERVTFAAMGLLDAAERPTTLSSVRLGMRSSRSRDVSCVLDLMIHDLDLALLLAGSEPAAVEAEGAFDHVTAEVVFASGLVARFEAGRAAPARSRTMHLAYASGEVAVDFVAPTFENRSAVALNPGFADTPTGRDPLGVSVARFVRAARGEGTPVADFAAGTRALDLALAVEAAAGL